MEKKEDKKMQKRGYCNRPLTDDEVRTIRRLRGKMTQAALAEMFDRTQPSIASIQSRATYCHVPDSNTAVPAGFGHVLLSAVWPLLDDEMRNAITNILRRT